VVVGRGSVTLWQSQQHSAVCQPRACDWCPLSMSQWRTIADWWPWRHATLDTTVMAAHRSRDCGADQSQRLRSVCSWCGVVAVLCRSVERNSLLSCIITTVTAAGHVQRMLETSLDNDGHHPTPSLMSMLLLLGAHALLHLLLLLLLPLN